MLHESSSSAHGTLCGGCVYDHLLKAPVPRYSQMRYPSRLSAVYLLNLYARWSIRPLRAVDRAVRIVSRCCQSILSFLMAEGEEKDIHATRTVYRRLSSVKSTSELAHPCVSLKRRVDVIITNRS